MFVGVLIKDTSKTLQIEHIEVLFYYYLFPQERIKLYSSNL